MMRNILLGAFIIGVMAAFVSVSSADQVSYTDNINLQTTNWDNNVEIPKFDSSLGTLNWIEFTLKGHVEGTAKFENEDAQPATVVMSLQAIMKLNRPDNTLLVTTIPLAPTSDSVTAYDGVTDYAGTSGKTYDNLTGDKTESFTSFNPSDFALFTGTDNIILPVFASGASTGSGAGNLALKFTTSGSAGVEVTYDYDLIPEPATMSLVAAGVLGGLAALRRRRKT